MADAVSSFESASPAAAESTRFDLARGLARRRGLLATPRRKLTLALAASLVLHLLIGAAADVEPPEDKSITLAAKLMPLPSEADPKQLSMITVNPPTASILLSDFTSLQAGDFVIQNAANSGVGGYIVQLAKLRGFRTVNIVRRESAVDGVRQYGGDVVVVDGDDLEGRVKAATGGAAIRLGIDAIGGKATDRLASCLGDGGVVVNYGGMSGEACLLSPRNLVFRDVTLKGFWLAKWFRNATPAQQMAVFGELAQHITTGKLQARIHATFPVSRIKEAVAAAAAGERDGKVLVVPEDEPA